MQPASIGITVAERVETPHLAMLAGNVEQPVVSPGGKAYALFVVRISPRAASGWISWSVGCLETEDPPRRRDAW
jgi:hypothetical protein